MGRRPSRTPADVLANVAAASAADIGIINSRIGALNAELEELLAARATLYARFGFRIRTSTAGSGPVAIAARAAKDGSGWASRKRANLVGDLVADYLTEQQGEPVSLEVMSEALGYRHCAIEAAIRRDARFRRTPAGLWALS